MKSRSAGVRVFAVAAVALAAVVLVWLLLIKGGDSGGKAPEQTAAAETVKLVPEASLPAALRGLGYPIYWAGPRSGVEYEVIRRHNGPENRTYVRYLPKGEEAGSKRHVLTVGSYELARAFASIHQLSQEPRAISFKVGDGGVAYAEHRHMTIAYLAFPGVGTEIEVYDPQPGKALRLIRSGAIVPVG